MENIRAMKKRLLIAAAALVLVSFGSVFGQKAGSVSVGAKGKPGSPTIAGVIVRQPLTLEGFIIEPDERYINEARFIDKIDQALQLLKSKSPDEFKTMQSIIGKIRATRASGANFNEKIMTIEIARRTFDASLEWLASVLIHETQHIKKYKDTGKKFGNANQIADKKVALQVMIDEEMECNRIQLIVLERIGGAQYEIDHLKAQKGDHFDIDKDGDYDWDDYQSRDW